MKTSIHLPGMLTAVAAMPASIQIATGVVASFALSAGLIAAAPEKRQPNIVFILIDDLGWGDTAPYGQRFFETPNFTRLASQGMKFTNAYAAAPICSASRAAILTGRSPARLNLEFVVRGDDVGNPPQTKLIPPAYPANLPLEEITLAEAIGPAGYKTGYFGKWHLSQHAIPENRTYLGYGKTHGPDKQGFHESAEERGSHPYNYPKDKNSWPPIGGFAPGTYAPDALTDNAIDFMRRNKDERFFLYLSHYYVHYPLHTRCQWLIDKYTKKAKQLGIALNEEQLTYATFVETMDHLLGRALDAIDELGLAGNTLVILTSDNGGDPRVANNILRGSKWTLYEGGVREPLIVRWPGVVKPGSTCDVPVIGMDYMPTLCEIAGAKPPSAPLDGTSMVPLLTGRVSTLERDTFIWHFPFYHPRLVDTKPCSSLRKGNYKLMYFYEDERTELFDLAKDPNESTDIAAREPALAAALKAELLNRLKSTGARFPKKRI